MSAPSDLHEMPRHKLFTLLFGQFVFLVLLGIALWYFSGRAIADFAQVDTRGLAIGAAMAAGMIALGVAIFLPFPKLSDRLILMQGETYYFMKDKLSFPAIIMLSIFAGVGEEALFRGGLQTLLGDYIGPVAAIAISATIFAVVHMAKPIIAVMIFMIGVLFGAVYHFTGSLLAVMVGHALYDVFAIYYVQRRLHELDFFAED